MSELLPFIVTGIVTGSIYGLAAAGLTMTYKTTGILNFGHGAIATTAAYCFYYLTTEVGASWQVAAAISVFVLGPVMGLMMQAIGAPLSRQGITWKIVGTVGLVLVVQSLGTIKYGVDAVQVERFLPGSDTFIDVFGVQVSYDQITILVLTVLIIAALSAFFRFSRLGIAMRAVVDDPDLVDMMGTKAVRVRRNSWMIGSSFAALSGVLVVPAIGLEPIALTLLVVQVFAAAAIGSFSNIPLTFVGGLFLGVASAVPVKYVIAYPLLGGLPDSVPFILLFIVLLVLPKRRLASAAGENFRSSTSWHGSSGHRVVGAVVVVLLLVVVPFVVGSKLSFWTLGLTQMLMLLSLGLLVKTAGQVSLCHVAFAAVGAVAFSQLHVGVGLPWIVAVVLGALVVVPIGALVALPAIRLSGVFLALATLGFGIMVERLFYPMDFMFTSTSSTGRSMPRPSFAEGDRSYYFVVLVFVVVTAITIAAINAGRLGRMLRGMGEAPLAVFTLGLNLNVTRLLVFCISAFFAGLSGILYGCLVVYASSSDPRFQAFGSIILLTTLALMPMRDPWYALIGGIAVTIPAYIGGEDTTYWMNVVFGVSAVLVAVQGGTPPMPMFVQQLLGRRKRTDDAPQQAVDVVSHRQLSGSGLRVEGVSVRFGGLLAARDVNLSAPLGSITGLIGPNGAGKTTTFNACSGIVRPSSGQIVLDDRDLTGLPPDHRARLGLGRTFQLPQLGESLTVFDNVALGWEASRAGRNAVRQVVMRPSERRERDSAIWGALGLCGLQQIAERPTHSISTGQRRLVELARALAGDFKVLLLDEPSAGLDHDETIQFGDLLTRVVDERGCGILLVEHDMSLVMRVCERIYVLDHGEEIFAGTPVEVAASPVVQLAYLGAEASATQQVPEEVVR